ncbi:MAG: DUF1302 family protein [Candidatus Phaeomarinobacter sp.]
MTTRNLRSALLGSAVGVGLLASGGQAHALSTEFGELKVFFDTTVSVGVQMKTKDARDAFKAEFNGGNFDARENGAGALTVTGANALGQNVSFVATDGVADNLDDSSNTDDRFLNFGSGDLTSANIKANHDLQMTWRNFTLFARATEFYDAVLNSDSAYNRFGIDDNNKEEVGRDVRLLDLYLSTDFDVGSLPVNFRAGKQVISWGEGTFIFNGINSVNPVDVSAFRRPGVEIKEGLIPVWALYGSIGLPFDLSLEAFYQLDWEPFQLDPAGTPFAGSDVANSNSSFGGNQGIGFYSGSIRNGFNQRNCTGTGQTALLAAAGGAGSLGRYNNLVGTGCSVASTQHFNTELPTDGSAQGILLSGYTGQGIIDDLGNARLLGTARGADETPSDSGQWGVALRYYSEELNSTEFGFYYMNYHSRLPIAQVRSTGVAQIVTSVTDSQGTSTTFGTSVGCFGGGNTGVGAFPAGVGLMTSGDFADPALRIGGFGSTGVIYDDPNNTAFNLGPTAVAGFNAYANALTLAAAAVPAGPTQAAQQAQINALAANATAQGAALAANPNLAVADGQVDLRTAAVINCGIQVGTGQIGGINAFTAAVTGGASTGDAATQLIPIRTNGTEFLAGQQNLETTLLYPEDIELWGVSFNTTIGDWGVQGEFSYRPNQPLQVDTTQQTISAAGGQCVGAVAFGDTNVFGLAPQSTEPGTQPTAAEFANGTASACQAQNYSAALGQGRTPTAFVREEVFTFQIGTTATYTNSNPLINFLGADIGILVTEFGLVHIPDVPNEDATAAEFNRLAQLCRSGTDLPLGGILALDFATGCAPTETSYGGILLTRLDYNNAFGSAWTLSPQLVYRHDLEGLTPAPLGNYLEDRRSLGFSLTANLQSTWSVGLSYTDFMGSEKYQNDLDDDFVSLTASYSF